MHQGVGDVEPFATRSTLFGSRLNGPAPTWAGLNIAAKELLPLVIGAAIWSSSWHGRCVNFITDNQAVVQVLSSHSARDPHLAHLLCSLFFFQAQFRFEIKAQHIPGKKNKAADALSRNNLTDFFSIFPQACKQTFQPHC